MNSAATSVSIYILWFNYVSISTGQISILLDIYKLLRHRTNIYSALLDTVSFCSGSTSLLIDYESYHYFLSSSTGQMDMFNGFVISSYFVTLWLHT